MKKLVGILAILCFAFAPGNFEVVKRIKTTQTNAELDGNGNVYLVDEKLNLCVFKRVTDTVKRFSVSNFGSDPIIDASNPLEIFLFFANTGKVVVFDNQLNIQQELNLFASGYMQPLAFGRANDGNIWILDKNSLTLKKYSRQGTLLNESIILTSYYGMEALARVFDNGERIIVGDGKNNLIEFDQNLVPKAKRGSNGKIIGYSNKDIFTENKGSVFIYNPSTSVRDSLVFQSDSGTILRVNSNYLLESRNTELILHAIR